MCVVELGTSATDVALAKWQPLKMPYRSAGLSARERQMIDKLVEASRYLENIFWRQSDPEGLRLYKTTNDPRLKRLFLVNGCRWDLFNENRPFVGDEAMPLGHALYPKGITREEIESYVKQQYARPAAKKLSVCVLRSVQVVC
jgi:hypothetical protein